MSLDITLRVSTPQTLPIGTGIFVRVSGATKELTYEEAVAQYPAAAIEKPSGVYETTQVFEGNITHNLGPMAKEAHIYMVMWRPNDIGYTKAADVVPALAKGLCKLRLNPERYKKHNPVNGWGSYEQLVQFVADYLAACLKYPDATIKVSR